jgi:hypothetical protein
MVGDAAIGANADMRHEIDQLFWPADHQYPMRTTKAAAKCAAGF